MKKIIIGIFAGIIGVFLLVAAAGFYKFNILEDDIYVEKESGNIIQYNDIIQVTSSIIPLSSVINLVGGDYVEVNNIVPAGVSPHGFDISAKQMVAIQDSELMFLTGLEHIDGFIEKAGEGKTQVHLADGMELLKSSGHEHHNEENHDEHDDEQHHDEHDDEENHDEHEDKHEDHLNDEEHHEESHDTDPHVWLGKDNILMISKKIRDELSAIMPEYAPYFASNVEDFESNLNTLYDNFAAQTAGKTPREFIIFHDAYNYLMQSVNMNLNLKVPFSENVLHEHGTAHIAELIEEIQLHGITHIFKEPQFDNEAIEKFVEDFDLILAVLDPLGTDPSASGYLENLQSNLEALSTVYE